MASEELKKPKDVRRLIYKELLAGDYRKLAAESNDATTGGGARDLRFPFKEFDGVFAKLLPGSRVEQRRRKGHRVDILVRTGLVNIDLETAEMVWESPTDARPSEGRIAKVHASPAASQLIKAGEDGTGADGKVNRIFVLLIQDDQGAIGVHYAVEEDLRNGDWAPSVARPLLTHLDDPNRRQDRAVTGYIDFADNFHYAHDTR